MTEQPDSPLESTTITHPTPTQDPAEQTVPGDDAAGEHDGADYNEDDPDAGSSPDAAAGAADDDDLDAQADPEGAAGGNGS